LALSKIRILRSFKSKKGLKTAIFQILTIVQDQDQDQERPRPQKNGLKDCITGSCLMS